MDRKRETSKKILVEVFHARPGEVVVMIQIWQKVREEGRWPATFSLGE